jgi:CBS domain-containing protein
MQVQDIMTQNPMCAEPTASLQQLSRMMVDCDCGGIPICESGTDRLIGFVTDRDIVCRVLAKGFNPLQMTAQDAMSTDIKTARPEASVDDIVRLMERYKVRRIPVTDDQGRLVGIVAQADLARRAVRMQPEMMEEFEEVLESVSEPKIAM